MQKSNYSAAKFDHSLCTKMENQFPSTTIDVSLTCSVLWQSSNLGKKCRFIKEKNFIPKPQHCGLDGRF